MSQKLDFSGNDLVIDQVYVGASTPGATGTLLSGTEISVLDGVTPGTATASKAVVLGSSKEISTITTATITNLTTTTLTPTTIAGGTFSVTPVLGAGTTINLDSATATLSSSAATLTKYAAVITSEALTTAAGSAETFVLTLTGVAAGDIVFITRAGGTNTRLNYSIDAVTTTNTVTITLQNNEPTNALNGTVILNVLVLKA